MSKNTVTNTTPNAPANNAQARKDLQTITKVGGYGVVSLTAAFGIAVRGAFVAAGVLLAMSTPLPALVALGAATAAYSGLRIAQIGYKAVKTMGDVNKLAKGDIDKIPAPKAKKFPAVRTAASLVKNAAIATTGITLLTMTGATLAVTICAGAAAALGSLGAFGNTFTLGRMGLGKVFKSSKNDAEQTGETAPKPTQKEMKKAVQTALSDKKVQSAFVDALDKKAEASKTSKPAKGKKPKSAPKK